MRQAQKRIALELGRMGTAYVVSAMNEARARYIVKSGVIPGEIDSVDLWRAEGYLEAVNKYSPVIKAAENVVSHYEIVHRRSDMVSAGQLLLRELEKSIMGVEHE